MTRQFPAAVALAESVAADGQYDDDLRLHVLMDLGLFYAYPDPPAASAVLHRIQAYPVTDSRYEQVRQDMVRYVSAAIDQAAARPRLAAPR